MARLLLLFSVLTLFIFNGAAFNKPNVQAQAATNISDNTIMARNAQTSKYDISLTNSCVEAGQTKDHCLCVTKIFKHEMTLREYKAAVPLYSGHVSTDATAMTTVRLTLSNIGYEDTEVVAIDHLQRDMTADFEFNDRCAVATEYFSASTE